MYHRVLPGGAPADWLLKSLVVDEGEFAEHVAWVARNFEVRTAFDVICNSRSGSRPCAAITFDDGYRDNFVYAAPILKRNGVPATFFVTSQFVGGRQRMWFEVASLAWSRMQLEGHTAPFGDWMSRLKRMSAAARNAETSKHTAPADWTSQERDAAMTWNDLLDLQRDGHEIGCHTRTHPILPLVSDDELCSELVGATEDLRSRGLRITGLAYPNGDFDSRVIKVAKQAGLVYGVSTRMGWHAPEADPFMVRRIDVNPALTRRWNPRSADGLAAEVAWRRFTVPRS